MSEPGTIELVGFMDLASEFRRRGWTSPHRVALDHEIGGIDLLKLVDVDEAAVESLFVNHKAIGLDDARIRPGDRVALVPPGVPGPHRFCLGIYQKKR
jgi:hypothetical protein